jgi:hypothetical protein
MDGNVAAATLFGLNNRNLPPSLAAIVSSRPEGIPTFRSVFFSRIGISN